MLCEIKVSPLHFDGQGHVYTGLTLLNIAFHCIGVASYDIYALERLEY